MARMEINLSDIRTKLKTAYEILAISKIQTIMF